VAHWNLHFFGRPTFERDGATALLTRPTAIAFVAYVALADVPLGRSELARFFWPELDLERGLASLRITLSRARDALGDGLLAADRHEVRIMPGAAVWIDVRRFEQLLAPTQLDGASIDQLEEALRLYRGDLLLGTSSPGSSEVEAWQTRWVERLRGRFHDALGRLADRHGASGRVEEAIRVARRLVGSDPLNEAAHRRLMQLCARAGKRADALRRHDECAAILREELGVEPDEETRRLRDTIERGGDFAARPGAPLETAHVGRSTGSGARPHALPAPMAHFVGRESEIALAEQRLDDPACRLLTLTGPGGVGKTELALAIARRRADRYPDGACFVPLAGVADPELVASAIADALRLPLTGGVVSARLFEHLRARRVLLIVDNLEHLLRGAATLAEIAAAAPGVQILATSRERSSLRGEWELVVDGLPCAEPSDPSREPPSAAVALFVATAARVDASFALSPGNAATIHRICALVGGMPLGIELSAARVRSASPAEIAAELERNLDAFAGPRDAPSRQRSIRASFDWSYGLLAPNEQAALRRLSVCRDGASPEAAFAVAGASPALLAALGEKFLLRRDGSGRWGLHALIRQFAAEALAAQPDEQREALARHAEYYTNRLVTQAETITGRQRGAARPAMAANHDNLRAALRWAATHRRLDLLERCLDSFAAMEEALGHAREAEIVFTEIVASVRSAGGAPALLGRALVHAGRFALEGGAIADAAARVEEGLHLLLAADASADLGVAHLVAGRLARLQGNFEAARWSLRVSLALARPRGDRQTIAAALGELGWASLLTGDAAKAQRLVRGALARFRALDDARGAAACHGALGAAQLFEGDVSRAEASCREGVRAGRTTGDIPLRAELLMLLGRALSVRGALDEAAAALDESLRSSRALGYSETAAAALHGQGLVALARGEPSCAADRFRESLTLRAKSNARHGIAEAELGLGRALAASDPAQSRAHLDAALSSAMEAQAAPVVLEALMELSATSTAVHQPALRRALALIQAHPAASCATRDRAAAKLATLGGRARATAARPADLPAIFQSVRDAIDG
jgi:predicted ATPase/DNA-binding SARP family transcriptional activator